MRPLIDTFECVLGACEKGLASYFLEVGLRRHLRRYHNMTSDPIYSMIGQLAKTKNNTAQLSHIVRLRK
jgi:hypothetical protein